MRSPGRFLRLRFLVPALVFLAVVCFFGSGWSVLNEGNERNNDRCPPNQNSLYADKAKEHFEQVCGVFAGNERIVITVNTGTTEILEKVPTQIRTSLLCAPNVYIFSDIGHEIGKHQVFDALDTVPASVMDGNTDFDIYRKQQELGDPVKVTSFLKVMRDPRFPDYLAAWTLDRYKKLHIVEKAWAMKLDMDWYLHIDADTYLIWPSLVAWLEQLDSSKESFLGSLSYINNLLFAHGGSGMLISGSAMRNFAVTHNGTASRWDYKMQKECCGDWVLAQILKEYGMDLMNSWPTISGESLFTTPFASDHWCQPLVTMHHISAADAQLLGTFEEKRLNKSALIYEELFNGLISDYIPHTLDDWSNMSGDENVPEISSAQDCFKACDEKAACLQSMSNGDECRFGIDRINLGVKDDSKAGKKWQSRWNKIRIAEWIEKQQACDTVTFPWTTSQIR